MNLSDRDHGFMYGEQVACDLRELRWAVSLEAPMTTSTWQCGIPGALCSSRSDKMFSLTLPSNGRGYLHVRINTEERQRWCRYHTIINGKLIVLSLLQRQRHLLCGPHSIGSSSGPGCCLSASTGLCPGAHDRGELVEHILPNDLIFGNSRSLI